MLADKTDVRPDIGFQTSRVGRLVVSVLIVKRTATVRAGNRIEVVTAC